MAAEQGFKGAFGEPIIYQESSTGPIAEIGLNALDSNKLTIMASDTPGLVALAGQIVIDGSTDGNVNITPNGTGTLVVSGGIQLTSGTVTVDFFAGTPGVLIADAIGVVAPDDGTTAGFVLMSNGTGVAPTFQAGGGGGMTVKQTIFTTSGTWTKDAGAKWVQVYGWSAGGGGGSGRKGTLDSSSGGGGGGGGGSFYYLGPAAIFSATETVVVGTGGAGGAAQTVDDTDGNAGANGTVSSFGYMSATPGFGGDAGNASSAAGGFGPGFANGSSVGTGSSGGSGSTAAGSNGESVPNGAAGGFIMAPTGGGGGGGSSATPQNGGAGGNTRSLDISTIITPGGTAGVSSGASPGAGGANFLNGDLNAPHGLMMGGTGGGGGGGYDDTLTTPAQTGAVGGQPGGGGGGGGGGASTSADSAAGGLGADGMVIVYEYI